MSATPTDPRRYFDAVDQHRASVTEAPPVCL